MGYSLFLRRIWRLEKNTSVFQRKRFDVWIETPLRLIRSAFAFKVKRPCVLVQTQGRFFRGFKKPSKIFENLQKSTLLRGFNDSFLFVDLAPCIFQGYGTVEHQVFRSRIFIYVEVTDTLELQVVERFGIGQEFFDVTFVQYLQ